MVCAAQLSRLLESFFLRVSILFSTAPRRTSAIDSHAHDGSFCRTITVVIHFLPESLTKFSQVSHDGTPEWSVKLTTDHQWVYHEVLHLQRCQFSFYFRLLFSSLHVLFGSYCTNCCYMQVLTLMALNKDRLYSRRHSKSVAPSTRLVIGSEDERDAVYVPPGTIITGRAASTTRTTPQMWRPAKSLPPGLKRSTYRREHLLGLLHTPEMLPVMRNYLVQKKSPGLRILVLQPLHHSLPCLMRPIGPIPLQHH